MKVTQELLKDIGFEEGTRVGECYIYNVDILNNTDEIIIYKDKINDMEVSELFKLIKELHKNFYYKLGEDNAKRNIALTLRSIINY